MPSTITKVLTARLPNAEADAVRAVAKDYGVTVTAAMRVLLNHSLRDLQGEGVGDG
jgi:antitoxin component of RelBE/YafQ-DinJ toxin-antitoxin module